MNAEAQTKSAETKTLPAGHMTNEQILAKANEILDHSLSNKDTNTALNCLHFIYHMQEDRR